MSETEKKEQFIYLDFLRGMAAVFVLLSHLRSFLFLRYPQQPNHDFLTKGFYSLTGLGHESVVIFFVLSGFLVGRSIYNAFRENRWSWRDYAINRLTRLWMVLIPALFLTCLWDTAGKYFSDGKFYHGAYYAIYSSGPHLGQYDASFWSFLINVFFLQTIRGPFFGSNGPLWSLANEFWYYLSFPILCCFLRARRRIAARFFYGACLILIACFLPPGLMASGCFWLMGYGLNLFLEKEYIRRMARSKIIFGLMTIFFIVSLALVRAKTVEASFVSDFLIALGTMLFMLSLIVREINPGFFSRIAQFFSRISYTLYLVHFPFLAFFFSVFLGNGKLLPVGAKSVGLFVVLFLVVLFYAWFVYALFEKKTELVRGWLKARLRRRVVP